MSDDDDDNLSVDRNSPPRPPQRGKARRKRLRPDLDDSDEPATSATEYADPNVVRSLDPPFSSEKEVAFEDPNFRINVQKVGHIQQRRFAADDHMFDVTVQHLNRNGPEHVPLMKSLQQIYKALKYVIKKLKKSYLRNADDHRQVYSTVISRNMLRGLRTGNYDLKTPTGIIATHIIYMIYYYLQSKSKNETLLDDSFKINFKVLSRASVQRRRGRGNFREHLYDHTGCGAPYLSAAERACILPVPDTFPGGSPTHFSNLCLLTSLVIANEQYKHKLTPSKEAHSNYLKLRYIARPQDLRLHQDKLCRAGELLFDLVSREISLLSDADRVAFTDAVAAQTVSLDFLTPFAKSMGAQVHVISQSTKRIIASFPQAQDYKQQLKQLYVYHVRSPGSASAHLYAITDIKQFQTRFGKTCLACKSFKRTSYKRASFECARSNCVKHCRACLREVMWLDTEVNAVNVKLFCDPFGSEDNLICRDCDIACANKECVERHEQICTKGKMCDICKVRVAPNANHACFSRFCKFCRVEFSSDHACPLQPPKVQAIWNRWGALVLAFEDRDTTDCFLCDQEPLTKCDVHRHTVHGVSNSKPDVYGAKLVIETQRETFQNYTFMAFDHGNCAGPVEERGYLRDIRPPDLTDAIRTRQGGHTPKERAEDLARFLSGSTATAVEKLLQFVLKCGRNVTILTHTEGANDGLLAIASALYAHNFCPNTLYGEDKLMLVELPVYGIRFINSQQFFRYSSYELQTFESPNVHFYPCKFKHPFFNYANQEHRPIKEDFFLVSDTAEVRLQKDRFFDDQFKFNPWHAEMEFHAYISQVARGLLIVAADFLKENFGLQQALTKSCRKAPARMLFPFNPPFCSLAGVAFALFQHYGPWQKLRHIQKESVGQQFRFSYGEYEWVSFVSRNLQGRLFSAFHAGGQKKIFHTWPDLYYYDDASNLHFLGFFHGCLFHGHSPDDCPVTTRRANKGDFRSNRNRPDGTKMSLDEAFAEFKGAISYIEQNLNAHVEVMWECEWQRLKTDNAEVRDFVLNMHGRPKKRLIPRDAYFGGFLETLAYKFDARETDSDVFFADDKNSAYGSACIENAFPVGQYKILIGRDFESNVEFRRRLALDRCPIHGANSEMCSQQSCRPDTEKYFYKNEELCGVAQVEVIPPRQMKYPFLLQRILQPRNKQLVIAALCAKCPALVRTSFCRHESNPRPTNQAVKVAHTKRLPSRNWYGTYTLADINYAKSLGYDFRFIECYHYSEQSNIFHNFYLTLFQRRAMYSELPPGCATVDQYCTLFNRDNPNLPSHLKLKGCDVKPDKAHKAMYKS